jgi:hypothetical protein
MACPYGTVIAVAFLQQQPKFTGAFDDACLVRRRVVWFSELRRVHA